MFFALGRDNTTRRQRRADHAVLPFVFRGTDETLFGVGRVYRNGSHGWYSFSSLRIIPIHGLARAELGGQRISSADLGIKLFDDSFTERLYELPDLRSRIQCIETVLVRSNAQARCSDKHDCFCGKPHSFVPRSAGDPFAGRRCLFVFNGIWNGGSSCLPDLPLKNTVGL